MDANAGRQCAGTINGVGDVSFPDGSCGGIHGNPNLHPLTANGGPTKTMLLGAGSAAFNAISGGGQAAVRPRR